MAITQRDVARLSGVAAKTVSNVFTGHPHVRPVVRARVLAAAAELGYQPNHAAQSLRNGRSGLIGLAVPELDVPYFAELTRHVVDLSDDVGLTVLIVQTFGKAKRERIVLDGFGKRIIDGLIFSPVDYDRGHTAPRSRSTPVVLVGERSAPAEFDHVGIDNVAAADAATQHLLSIGRRRLMFLGVPRNQPIFMASLRERGLQQALARAGLAPADVPTPLFASYHLPDGYAAARELIAQVDLSTAVDGILCANDLVAQGAIRAFHEAGFSVPADIAVAAFDDSPSSSYATPAITTISQDKRQIAQLAMDMLVRRMGGDDSLPSMTRTGWTLQVRESTVTAP